MDKQALSAGILRVSMGILLLAHGLLKILVFTVPGTVAYFASLGLLPIAAYLTILGELGIGVALIIGIKPRLFALASIPIFTGATWAHSSNGWLFSNPNGGWEFPLLLMILAGLIVLQGGGKLFNLKEAI